MANEDTFSDFHQINGRLDTQKFRDLQTFII